MPLSTGGYFGTFIDFKILNLIYYFYFVLSLVPRRFYVAWIFCLKTEQKLGTVSETNFVFIFSSGFYDFYAL